MRRRIFNWLLPRHWTWPLVYFLVKRGFFHWTREDGAEVSFVMKDSPEWQDVEGPIYVEWRPW